MSFGIPRKFRLGDPTALKIGKIGSLNFSHKLQEFYANLRGFST